MEPIPLGKYALLSRLAWGGMAELYLARANAPNRADDLLVIKLVARRFAEDVAFVTMFQDEAKIAAQLDHPQIGRILDVGEHEGRHYLVMEYLHGKDLRSICRRSLDLERGPVPAEVAVRIGIKVCSALQHAHVARGADGVPLNIIHRDVSPSNVMLTFDGRIKLVDFGIAKAANRATLTQPGLIKGKLRYLSPEQILGQKLDHRTDIFIFGTTLWECTLGRHLFEGNDEALIYQAISEGRVPAPSAIQPSYSPLLESVILRALAKDRADRFTTAREMQAALEDVASALEVDLTCDGAVLSRYLGDLFREEVEDWRQASQGGRSLLQHVVDTTPPAPDEMEPDIGVNPRPLPTKPRRTLHYGEEPSADQASGTPPQLEGIPVRSFKASQAYPVVGKGQLPTGEGNVVGRVTGDLEPASSDRPTVIEPDELATMPYIREGHELVAAQSSQLALGKTVPSGELVLPAELMLGPAEQDDDELIAEERPKTGDWSQQRFSSNTRPGTHPMFKEPSRPGIAASGAPAGAPPAGPSVEAPAAGSLNDAGSRDEPTEATGRSVTGDLAWELPRRSPRILLALIVIGFVAVAGLGLLMWVLGGDPPQDVGVAPPEAAASAKPAAAKAAPDGAPAAKQTLLMSEPAGATAYDASTGQELGRTPISLDPSRLGAAGVELRFPGYLAKRVTAEMLGAAGLRVVLEREPADPPARQKKTPRGHSNPAKGAPKLPDDLVNPFGK